VHPETISIGTGLTILGLAFGGWAGVVAWGIGVIRREVKDIKDQVHITSQAQITHVNQTERRLTMLETEFAYMRRITMHAAHSKDDGYAT
jgi:hypothetical protein